VIEILPQSSETNIGFKVSGKVTIEDYDVLLPKVDEAISAHGKINLLVMIDDLEGWKGMDAAKADFKFGTHEYRLVGKAAFVGDKKWQKWMVKIMDPFTRQTDERYFEVDQLDDAWQWIKEDNRE
jgi:hypothetical protein